jgi:hypothetical protein
MTTAMYGMATPEQAIADAGRAHPECTGRQLRDYLKASGTPDWRIEFIDKLLLGKPDSDGKLITEQMIQAGRDKMPEGTVLKAGKYVYGPTFSLAIAGASASTEEIDRLRGQIGNLEGHIRDTEGRNAIQGQELMELRTVKARLTDDLDETRSRLAAAQKEIQQLRETPAQAEAPTQKPATSSKK